MNAHKRTDASTETAAASHARPAALTRARGGAGAAAEGEETELLVIGGGPAGVSGALMAASLGLRVTLVDAGERIGGRPWEIGALENVPGGWRDGPALARALAADVARLEETGRCARVRGRAARITAYEDHAEVALADGVTLTGAAALVATGVAPLGVADVAWAEAPEAVRVPPVWRAGPGVGHAVVLGGDRSLGTWLRAYPEVQACLEVLYPHADAYKMTEVAADPRVRPYEVERVSVREAGGGPGFEVTARGTDGATRTLAVDEVLANMGVRPSPPAGDLVRGPEGYCPLASQGFRLLTAGDLRSARHQRITPAQGSGAEAALTYYYAAHR